MSVAATRPAQTGSALTRNIAGGRPRASGAAVAEPTQPGMIYREQYRGFWIVEHEGGFAVRAGEPGAPEAGPWPDPYAAKLAVDDWHRSQEPPQ